MFQKIRLISGLMVFLVLFPALSGAWVPVTAVKKMVVELAEIITRKGSKAIRELAEMGGEKALKEIAGEVAETGGEKAGTVPQFRRMRTPSISSESALRTGFFKTKTY